MLDGFIERVGKRRIGYVAVEQSERIVFDEIRRCGSESNLDCGEVLENILVDVVDASMALIGNYHVEEEG